MKLLHIKDKINSLIGFYSLSIAMLLLALFMSSCDEDDNIEYTQSRMFSPVNFKAEAIGNTVYFSWVPIKGADYLLEISKDSLLFETDLQEYQLSETTNYTVEDLENTTMYSARIKSLSSDPAIADSKFVSLVFTSGVGSD